MILSMWPCPFEKHKRCTGPLSRNTGVIPLSPSRSEHLTTVANVLPPMSDLSYPSSASTIRLPNAHDMVLAHAGVVVLPIFCYPQSLGRRRAARRLRGVGTKLETHQKWPTLVVAFRVQDQHHGKTEGAMLSSSTRAFQRTLACRV